MTLLSPCHPGAHPVLGSVAVLWDWVSLGRDPGVMGPTGMGQCPCGPRGDATPSAPRAP